MPAFDVNALKDRGVKVVRSFSPQQLTMVALLAVVALVGGFTFLRWVSAPSYGVLYSGLSAEDAGDVVEELKSKGVDYKLQNDGTTILVTEADVYDTRLELSAAGVPRGGAVGYELLDKQSFTTSEFRQRVDYQRAVEGELSRTLMALEGVESATVHLAIPEETLFEKDEKPTRASVLLRTREDLGEEQVQSVVNLVASSVPGLDPDDVTVADDSGHVLSVPGGAGGLTDNQLEQARAYEAERAAAAETMLSRVLGPGHAVVRVSADLNFDETSTESERYNPDSSVPLAEENTRETFTGTGAPPQGELGVDGGPLPTQGSNNEYEKETESRQNGVDRVVTKSKQAPGQVERLSIAVVLDGSATPVPDATTVQDLVAAAVGFDPARGDQIVVDTVAFDETLDEAAEEAQSAAQGEESRERLFGTVRTAVGALVLLLVAFFLWRGTRSTKEEDVELPELGPGSVAAALAAHQPAGALAPVPAGVGAATAAAPVAGLAPMLTGEAPTGDVLSLIDQQPEEVAELLRSWLADRRG